MEANAEDGCWEFPGGFGSRIHGQIENHRVHIQALAALKIWGPSKDSVSSVTGMATPADSVSLG